MNRPTRLTLAALAVLAGTAHAQQAAPIRIGVVTPLSGTYAGIGQQVKWGLDLAARQINASGGVMGRQVELVYEDGAFGSGLAALDAVLKLLRAGDHVVCGDNVYGGTQRLMERIYAELGLTFTFVDMRDLTNVERALGPATRMVYCELAPPM